MKTIKRLEIIAHVRHWNDTDVNGVEDIDFYKTLGIGQPLMPCAKQIKNKPSGVMHSDHWVWNPIIDVEKGLIINWVEGNIANVCYKVYDGCEINAFDADNNLICNNDGFFYCPDFLCPKEEGFGDYIIMDIDIDGSIRDWNKNKVYEWIKNQINENN